MVRAASRAGIVGLMLVIGAGAASAQAVVTGTGGTASQAPTVTAPPSVDNGVGNGVVKPAGAPSVGNGVGNGVVKPAGAPSVGNGVGNGVVKSPTVEQKTQ